MKKVAIFLIVLVLIVAAFDIYLIVGGMPSISNVLLVTSKSWPIIPFLFGALCGHLFWPNIPEGKK
jgi:hypothetical protein